MKRFKIFLPLFFCFVAAFSQQHERIISYHSDIVIDTSGRVEVAEQIKVYAAGKEIKRGIVREIPVFRKNNKGKNVRMKVNILTVQCNGESTKFHTEKENGNLAVYIGDENVWLTHGEYNYTIVYESFGHIGFFENHDELYWNVTGNDWIFNIEQASATITLPGNATAINTYAYTGKFGLSGKDYSVIDNGNVQEFATTRMLNAKEGLTVAVSFPRDIVKRPPPPSKAQIFWSNYQHHICFPTGLLICLLYCFYASRKVGKRPEKRLVIPYFTPPRKLSPAAIHYLFTRFYEIKAFTATLVEMAVKGAITIRCEKTSRSSIKYVLENKENTERLRPEEKQIHAKLFSNGEKEVSVNSKNHKKFSQAQTGLEKSLKSTWNLEDYMKNNGKYPAILLLISVAVSVLYVLLSTEANSVGETEIHWLTGIFIGLMVVLLIVFAFRIRRFTHDGAALNNEIKGFKLYMKKAEQHRLNLLTPPELTPELFEKLLPYSIALGVSNEWCKKFDNVLQQFDYQPEWYHHPSGFATTGFATTFAALGTSFNTSVAHTNPSSSGSGGWSSGNSGFSGGGGGGGGGRGW